MSLVNDERLGEGEKKARSVYLSILRDRQENAQGRTCEEKRETRRLYNKDRGGGRRKVDGGESWIKRGG